MQWELLHNMHDFDRVQGLLSGQGLFECSPGKNLGIYKNTHARATYPSGGYDKRPVCTKTHIEHTFMYRWDKIKLPAKTGQN